MLELLIQFRSLFLISSANSANAISSSLRVVTSRSFTMPFSNSESPNTTAKGICCSSQCCSCANSLGFSLYECSACKMMAFRNDSSSSQRNL